MLVVNLFSLALCFVITCGINRKYHSEVKNVCYQQHNDVISDGNGVISLAMCLGICLKKNCCSLMFHAVFQRCITYHVVKTTMVPGCEWKYAEVGLDSCPDTTTYIPTAPNTCALGYSYNSSDNTCVGECIEYGMTFGTFYGFNIPSLYNRTLTVNHPEECAAACLEATMYFCRTADMSIPDRRCYLSVVSKPTYAYGVDSRFIMWQINCA